MAGFKVDFKYSNDIELLDLVLYMYSKSVLKTQLTDKRRVILREYLLHGYNEITKEAICTNLKMKRTNLNTQNSVLQKQGFLHPSPNKASSKTVDKSLIELKNIFLSNENKKIFLVDMIRK